MMDLSRAMNILELPSLQKFENTSEDEISKAFKKDKKITKMNIKKQPNGALYGPCLDHVARFWHKDNYLI